MPTTGRTRRVGGGEKMWPSTPAGINRLLLTIAVLATEAHLRRSFKTRKGHLLPFTRRPGLPKPALCRRQNPRNRRCSKSALTNKGCTVAEQPSGRRWTYPGKRWMYDNCGTSSVEGRLTNGHSHVANSAALHPSWQVVLVAQPYSAYARSPWSGNSEYLYPLAGNESGSEQSAKYSGNSGESLPASPIGRSDGSPPGLFTRIRGSVSNISAGTGATRPCWPASCPLVPGKAIIPGVFRGAPT